MRHGIPATWIGSYDALRQRKPLALSMDSDYDRYPGEWEPVINGSPKQMNAIYRSTRLNGRHTRSYSTRALSLSINEPDDWRTPRKHTYASETYEVTSEDDTGSIGDRGLYNTPATTLHISPTFLSPMKTHTSPTRSSTRPPRNMSTRLDS